MKNAILKPPDTRLNQNASFSKSITFVVIHIGAIINRKTAKDIANIVCDEMHLKNVEYEFTEPGIYNLLYTATIEGSNDNCEYLIILFN